MVDIALALGGGGVKGIAHVGVIRKLEQEGFHVRAVAGTSAGGLIGSVLAAGYSPQELENIVQSTSRSRLFSRISGEGPGLLGLSGLAQILVEVLGQRRFEELKLPFACTAVDLISMQEVILSQGRVIDAVLATIAVPGVFPPKEIDGTPLIDGGVLDPVPVALARWLAPSLPVIAVVLSPVPEGWRHLAPITKGLLPPTPPLPIPIPLSLVEQISRLRIAQALNIFARSYDITTLMLAELRLQMDKPEAIIRPDVHKYGMLDEVDAQDMILLGEKAAAEALPQIRQSITWRKKVARRFRRVEPPGKLFNTIADRNGKELSSSLPESDEE